LSNIIWLRRRIASPLVIAKLVELGYLKQAKRDNARAVENAIVRLRQRLYRDGVICGDLSGHLSQSELERSPVAGCEALGLDAHQDVVLAALLRSTDRVVDISRCPDRVA
jgi:hypothetical protein